MKNIAIVVGICFALLGGIVLAFQLNWAQRSPVEAEGKSGRYVMYQLGIARADQYVVDSATGRVWRIVSITDNKEYDFQLWPVPYHTGQGLVSFKAPGSRVSEQIETNGRSDDELPPRAIQPK